MTEGRFTDSSTSLQESSSGSPGTILRRCREFHGMTLEDASETTKIGISHLKALENDQIGEFANQAYLKGFLRIYATYLGLNSDDVARMYEKLFGIHGEKPDTTRAASPAVKHPGRLSSLKKMLFPAFLLALILVTATFFKHPSAPPVSQQQPPAIVAPPRQISAVQLVQSSVRSIKTEQNIPVPKKETVKKEVTDPEISTTAKPPAETNKVFILKIKVTQGGTLTANVDGSGAQQYELTIGDIIEWKVERKVTLELSNAGGADIELNGNPYKSLGPPGKPAYVELDADSVKP